VLGCLLCSAVCGGLILPWGAGLCPEGESVLALL